MILLVRMPSSIASLVFLGRHSTACRNSLIVARCCLRIGFIALSLRRRHSICARRDRQAISWRRKERCKLKLGVHVGYWGLGMGPEDQLQVVQEAERLGYESVWTAEAYGSDAATVLAWLASQTSKLKLGSAIFQMPGRSAAMTAMTAAAIDELSGGRMMLGIGSSGPQVAEGWHGQRFGRQLQRTREYVAVVRT